MKAIARIVAAWVLCLGSVMTSTAAVTGPPRVAQVSPAPGQVTALNSITVTFNEEVTGIVATDLLINDVPVADSVTGSGTTYVFEFALQPAYGPLQISWNPTHNIVDFDSPATRFDETHTASRWQYSLVDQTPPTIATRTPVASAGVRQLTQIEVLFSEPVAGVDAADLLINGVAASGVSVTGPGRYLFAFPQPPNGAVTVAWSTTHGIADFAANPFSGGSWSYTLDPNFQLPSIRINEFLAANVSGLTDEDVPPEPQDWIEIWNYGASAVNLNGYALTDDRDDPGRWTFPSTNLAPGQYLVVFASGKDRKAPTSSAHRLHTNFKLNPNGEYLALYNNELPRVAITEFAREYPEQRNNYSYGFDTTNALKYFATPTPGAANGVSAISSVLPPPHFNVDRGLFDAPFTLILNSTVPGATVHYTTDGTEPALGSSSLLTYSEPLTISNVTVLRAAAFKTNMLPSVTVTHTYLFLDQVVQQPAYPAGFPTNWGTGANIPDVGSTVFSPASTVPGLVPADYQMDLDPLRVDPNNTNSPIDPAKLQRLKDGLRELPVLSIVMKTDDIFGTAGLYQRSADETGTPGNKPENKKPCSVEMILPDGTTAFTTTCGIDLHGNASRNPVKNPKHGFKLTFRDDFGPPTLQYRLFEDSPVEEFDDIDLRPDFNSSWRHWSDTAGQGLGAFQRTRATRTRDAWMKNAARDMGALASHSRFVHVYLNGLYWGTYDLSEDPSETFAKTVLGGNDEDFDVVDQGVLKNGTLNFYNSMISLPAPASLPQYEQYHQYLNVPEFIDYMLLHFYIGHQDWSTTVNKNWAAIRKRVSGAEGTFRYLPWDGECILLNEDVNRVTVTTPPSGLHTKLIANPEYRLAFADRIHRHMVAPDGALIPSANIARWQKWEDIMDKPIVAESARWGDYRRDVHRYSEGVYQLYTREAHVLPENVRMRGYFSNRTARVIGQLQAVNLYPATAAPVFSQQGGRVARGFNLTMAATNTIYYTLDGSDPRVYGTGAISPQAQVYSAAVVLNNSAVVKARALFGASNWSALNEADFQADTLGVPLRITEIMYNPIGGDAYEFLEIQNVGGGSLNVGGFFFDGITYVFPPNTVLAPGQTIVLGSDASPANWNARYPGATAFGRFAGSLANGGEKLSIIDPSGAIVHSVDYDDEDGWVTQPDGDGYSLQIVDVFGDPDDPANWRASDAVNGTPGTQVGAPPSGPVIINEVMAENLTAVPNGSTYPDWIEIRNAGGSSVNLAGWSLSDDGNPRKFVFPSTTIPANGYLVVWCDSATNTTPGLHTGFALGRNGESVFLYNANTVRVDSVTFGLQLANYSVGRVASEWRLTTPTPNAANAVASLGASSNLVINEWLANAVPGGADWIELYNRSTTTPVSLDGIYLSDGNTIFQFSALSFIASGGFVQIFADELAGPDHVDFKLTASGGSIVLYDEAGEERDRVLYGSQAEGVSEGRLPDGSGNIVSFPISPSPAASNYLIQYTGPRLNEVLAINKSAVTNNAGRTADWIELRNANAAAFDLSGMRLSTDAEDSAQWVFPVGTSIPANGYLVVWFDDERPASTSAGGLLNTGRSLDGESEDVYLFNASGQAVDSVQYGFQVPDRTIGLAGTAWTLLASPTPGAANSAAATLGSAAALRINEWMANPTGGDDDWFELYNNSDQPVALDGVYVTDNLSIAGATQSPLAPLSFIGARGFVRIIADADRNKGRDHAAFNLDTLGEALRIYVPALGSVDAIYFDEQEPGVSQGRIPDGADNFASFATTPTPAESNYLPAPNAVISEVLTHTDLPLEDAVEIFNPSGSATNIGGWFLSDNTSNYKKYRIPAGTTLNPLGFKVIYQNDLTSGPGALVPFTLDSVRGDTIYLSAADASGNLTGYRSVVDFGAAFNGVAFGRYLTTVGADFPALLQRSFGVDNPSTVTQFRTGAGAANAYPRVGPVVLNEVMFHPPDIGTNDNTIDEYIELHNLTTNAVALYDPAYPTNTWRVRGGVDFQFPGNVTLSSRAFVLIVSFNPVTNTAALNAFRATYSIPASVPIFGPYRGKLDNGGEEIELYRPDSPQSSGPEAGYVPYVLVDKLVYGDTSPWPFTADGGGASLQRQRPDEYGNDPVNWDGEGLSPGRPNVPGSTYTDADADGLSDQWETANGFSSANRSDADGDADGDGETNLQEYWAGTNPRNGSSYLAVPTITSHPQSATGVAGFGVTLSVAANGTAPLSYKWRFNGRDIVGATNTSLSLQNLRTDQAGQYEAVVMNARGYAVSQSAVLIVHRPARIELHPVSLVVTNGTNVTFTVAATGTGTIRYQWQFNGVDIPGATGSSYMIANAQVNHSGEYRAVVTDDIASIESHPATLEVRMRPSFVEHPQSQTLVVGSTLTLSVRVQGSTPIGYRWRKNGINVTNIVLDDTNCVFVIPNVQTNHSGTYAVIVTNAALVVPGIQSAFATVNVVEASADTDGDGMPDDWETQYNFNINSGADALQDADGDGMTNLHEYNAGTNPRDALSYLRLRLIRSGGSSLTFNAVANRTYSIQYRDSLSPGVWQLLQNVPAGSAREVQINDAAGGSTRFYRLRTP